jgi:3D (Asp-Asp-Asp) domain-containing protein
LNSSAVIQSRELMVDISYAPTRSATTSLETITHPKIARTIWMDVTAYCPCKKCCGSRAKGITSSGRPVSYNDGHFIAADIKVLPYGTKVIVPGYNDGNPVEVIDRGGAIKGNHVDIFMQTHPQAVEWGKRRLEVQVVE